MNEWADRCPGSLVTLESGIPLGSQSLQARDLEREFEERLRESSGLAFRVAYGVVRQRQDAEDVAQEAFAASAARSGPPLAARRS